MISATNLAVDGAAISASHTYSPYMHHHHLANHHLNHHHHRNHQERYHRTIIPPPPPPGSTNSGSIPSNLPLNLGSHLGSPLINRTSNGPIKVQAIHPVKHNQELRMNEVSGGGGTEALLNGVPHEALFRISKHRYGMRESTPGPVDLAQPKDNNHQYINHYPPRRDVQTANNHRFAPNGLGFDQQSRTSFAQNFFQYANNNHQDLTNFYAKEIYDMRNGGGGFVPPKPPAVYANQQQKIGGEGKRDGDGQQQHQQQQQQHHHQQQQQQTFKVPSGKEGSLKHRILRPSPPASVAPLSPQSPSLLVTSPTAAPTVNCGFSRGALIRLEDGDVRKVEDMRADDFRRSAEATGDVQLTDVTVVRISVVGGDARTRDESNRGDEKDVGGEKIVLTLSFNQHRDRVDFETSQEHPFFVYGQGWASFSPDATMKKYGLKCNRLQVGDICISLTRKDKQSTPPSTQINSHALKSVKPHYPSRTSTTYSVSSQQYFAAGQTMMDRYQSRQSSMTYVGGGCYQGQFMVPNSGGGQQQSLRMVAEEPQNLTMTNNNNSNSNNKFPRLTTEDDSFMNCKKRRWSAPDDTLLLLASNKRSKDL